MANNIIKRVWNQNRMVAIEDLRGMAFQAESGGHTFQISGVDDQGNEVPLSGTVAGVFLRPDNADVAITGSASGGVVSVTLPAECYDMPGRFGLTVFVTESGQKTAVYAAIGTVSRTSSGAVAPQTAEDVVDLINDINAAVATIPASWTGLMADIAPTYSASALYPVGSYVYYDGDLYRCTTAITTAESWTAAHWTAAAIGADILSLKNDLGDPFETLVSVQYTITNSKKFNNRDHGNTMGFTDNATYHYILLSVSSGEKYSVRTYFTSANTYYIYMCDANGVIVSRDHNASGISGSQTFDVEIPNGIAQLYIQGYSSAATIDGRMNVKKYQVTPYSEVITGIDTAVNGLNTQLTSIKEGLRTHDANAIYPGFTLGRMRTDGSVSDATTYAKSRIIAIYEPSVISLPGYYVAVNQYNRYNYSSTMLVKNWLPYTLNGSVTVYADSYPVYIMVGVYKTDSSDITSAELSAIGSALTIVSLYPKPLFASIAMFDKFALTGCSWDAGTAYDTLDGHVTHTGIGWGETLGRRNGCAVGNFAIGGSNLRSWFNYIDHPNGFPALLLADAYPLYILTEGNSNDANAFEVNDSDYSPTVPSTTKYYVGSVEDISTRSDYHDYPCTFFGYYGRVIEMIQAHAPKTRIIISSPDTTPASSSIRRALQDACLAIAEYYGLPYMNIQKDPYYDIYVNALVGNHPTAPTYSGWAMAIERCFADCVRDNLGYFQLYSGLPITAVEVPWTPVQL